tara:strand:- start:1151 stop:1294 length:144 start_codon:yes stop_codon:yes gene_type:complete
LIFYDKGVANGTKSGRVSICWRNISLRQDILDQAIQQVSVTHCGMKL